MRWLLVRNTVLGMASEGKLMAFLIRTSNKGGRSPQEGMPTREAAGYERTKQPEEIYRRKLFNFAGRITPLLGKANEELKAVSLKLNMSIGAHEIRFHLGEHGTHRDYPFLTREEYFELKLLRSHGCRLGHGDLPGGKEMVGLGYRTFRRMGGGDYHPRDRGRVSGINLDKITKEHLMTIAIHLDNASALGMKRKKDTTNQHHPESHLYHLAPFFKDMLPRWRYYLHVFDWYFFDL